MTPSSEQLRDDEPCRSHQAYSGRRRPNRRWAAGLRDAAVAPADKLAKLGLTVEDVTPSHKRANKQAASARSASRPARAGVDFQYTVNVKEGWSRAKSLRILYSGRNRRLHPADQGRGPDGAGGPGLQQHRAPERRAATVLIVYQLSDANALDTAKGVNKLMDELSHYFPPGLAYEVSYDNTRFITASLEEVVHTFFEALVLVALVVFLFLGPSAPPSSPCWRSRSPSSGPSRPSSLSGFSINTLTLFGLVLAIGSWWTTPSSWSRRWSTTSSGAAALRGRQTRHGRGRGPGGGHRAGPLRGVRAVAFLGGSLASSTASSPSPCPSPSSSPPWSPSPSRRRSA